MKIYKIAIYTRLSIENKNTIENESITNQRRIIENFIQNDKDLKNGTTFTYTDNGFSGGNFERPAFKKMLEDIKNRKINCIIVKDFSRFGREFVQMSRYIEEIFPFLEVRFISINDNYDSLKHKDIDNLLIPFKNLVNDSYLRDISLKIRTSLDIKRKNGEFTGAFVTYGYLKDPLNKNKIIIDKTACNVVKEIFKLKIEGYSNQKIAQKLNDFSIPSPLEYKKLIGLNYKSGFKTKAKASWSPKAILRILENKIYIGTLEQKKVTTFSYKSKKKIIVPKDKRITILNNHEPIIDKALFENIQNMLAKDTRTAPKKEKVYPFAGLIYCGICGNNMIRKNNGTSKKQYIYYICNGAKQKNGCQNPIIKEDILQDTIYNIINKEIEFFTNIKKDALTNIQKEYTNNQIKKILNTIEQKKDIVHNLKNINKKIVNDLKEEILNKNEYEYFHKLYTKKLNKEEDLITYLEKDIANLKNNKNFNQLWLSFLKENKNIKCLNRKIIFLLINKILLYKNKIIYIFFKFKKDF